VGDGQRKKESGRCQLVDGAPVKASLAVGVFLLVAVVSGCGSGGSSSTSRTTAEAAAHQGQWSKIAKAVEQEATAAANKWDPTTAKPGEAKTAAVFACLELSKQIEEAAGLKPSGPGFKIGANGQTENEPSPLPRWVQDDAIYSLLSGLEAHPKAHALSQAFVDAINSGSCDAIKAPPGEEVELES